MKRKNTEASVGIMVATALFVTIMFLLAGAVLVGLLRGSFRLFDPGKPLLSQLLSWSVILGGGMGIKHAAASLWLWWSEIRGAAKSAEGGTPARGRWKKPLTALVLFGLIASAPFWLVPIHFAADGPEVWMLLYALYLLFAGLVTILPCALIYGLGVSLAEKEMEQEEREEAKKY